MILPISTRSQSLSPAVGSAGIAAFNLGGVAGAIAGALAFAKLGSKPTMLTMAAGSIAGALVMRTMIIGPDSATMPIIAMLGITGGLINAVQTTMYALAAQVYPNGCSGNGCRNRNRSRQNRRDHQYVCGGLGIEQWWQSPFLRIGRCRDVGLLCGSRLTPATHSRCSELSRANSKQAKRTLVR